MYSYCTFRLKMATLGMMETIKIERRHKKMRKVRIFYDPECRTTICSRSCRKMATHINSIRTRGEGGETTKKTIFKLNLGKNIVINAICSDIKPMFQQPVTPRVWRDEYKWASQDNTHHTIILGNDAKEYFPTAVKLGPWLFWFSLFVSVTFLLPLNKT